MTNFKEIKNEFFRHHLSRNVIELSTEREDIIKKMTFLSKVYNVSIEKVKDSVIWHPPHWRVDAHWVGDEILDGIQITCINGFKFSLLETIPRHAGGIRFVETEEFGIFMTNESLWSASATVRDKSYIGSIQMYFDFLNKLDLSSLLPEVAITKVAKEKAAPILIEPNSVNKAAILVGGLGSFTKPIDVDGRPHLVKGSLIEVEEFIQIQGTKDYERVVYQRDIVTVFDPKSKHLKVLR